MDRRNAIIVVLVLLLICSTSTSFLMYRQQQHLIEQQEELIEQLLSAGGNAGSSGGREEQALINGSGGASSANIVAVRSDTYSGVIGKVHVEVKEGNGNVLVNTNPFVEPVTQYSIREAVRVAESFTNMNVSNKDVIISFEINGTLIGGPSAGAATTVALIAAMEGKHVIKQDAAITGTIEEGGYIGQVGSMFEKAVVAEKNGMELFLVPKGQKKLIYYEQKTEAREIFGFTFTRIYYIPKEIDLGEYMDGKMDVKEVATVGEAVAYMIE